MSLSFWSGLIRLGQVLIPAAGDKFVIGEPAEAEDMLTVQLVQRKEGATVSDDQCPSDEQLAAQLDELQRTVPDLPLDELNLEQLADLQRVTANLLNWGERKLRDSSTSAAKLRAAPGQQLADEFSKKDRRRSLGY